MYPQKIKIQLFKFAVGTDFLKTTMPGYKVVVQDGEIREELTCSYCKLLLKDPVQTSESGLRLCRECYDTAYRLVLHNIRA